jgi:hypothetical protein
VGNLPTVPAVKKYIYESVRVQGCRDLKKCNGENFRMLAIYWHPELDLVMKVDHINNRAVSVLSKKNFEKRNGYFSKQHRTVQR